MENIRFEWDEHKNEINKKMHGISFEEARTVFLDPNGLMIPDPDHSEKEEWFVLLGASNKANLLVLCHCFRYSDTVIR